jgi:hypothetical protein
MGYEIKMLVVARSSHGMNNASVLIPDDKYGTVYNCYQDKGNDTYYYYPDHNTKTVVPLDAVIKVGPWCELLAMVEFCKIGSMPGICKFEESDGCYVYDPFDGNKILGLDGYGDYRKFVPIQEVIDTIKENIEYVKDKGHEPYHRFVEALPFLKQIKKSHSKWHPNDIGCLFYGH